MLSGFTLSKINLTNVAIAGAPHLYTCKAENDYGAVMKNVTINVYSKSGLMYTSIEVFTYFVQFTDLPIPSSTVNQPIFPVIPALALQF